MYHRQGNARLLAMFVVFIVILIGVVWWSLALVTKPTERATNTRQACTKEAKVCPDGSTVGRIGPNCEFALCPNAPANTNSRANDGCIITGCSGQVCDDHEVITTCEFRPEYACYTTACARQANGRCGWTMTTELEQCLRRY